MQQMTVWSLYSSSGGAISVKDRTAQTMSSSTAVIRAPFVRGVRGQRSSARMGPMLARLFVSSLAILGLLNAKGAVASSDNKVLVEFYSESLCPYCANFVVNYLVDIFDNGIIDIVNLRIIPYGNAHTYPNGQTICQHGEDECKLNTIQTCAINLWPNVTQWFPFVYCLEKLVVDLPRPEVYPNWKTCPEPAGLPLEPIEKCFDGPLGDKWESDNAEETSNLDPPHRYVPWVIVNGTPLFEDYLTFEKYVCQAYNGTAAKPKGCAKYSIGASDPMIQSVIHKDNTGGVCKRLDMEN